MARRAVDVAKLLAAHRRYLTDLPTAVPPGIYLVHNHVRPAKRLGTSGFRAWLQTDAADPALEPCPCRWAPACGPHYRVAILAKSAA
jgi:hypothetical protein